MTYLEGADYFIYVADIPAAAGAQVVSNGDGTFSMYLPANKGRLELVDDYIHEYEHIEDDDFYNDKSIEEIEK